MRSSSKGSLIAIDGDVMGGDVGGGDVGGGDVGTLRLGGFAAIGGRTFVELVRKVRGMDDVDACLERLDTVGIERLDTVGSSRGSAPVEERDSRCLAPYAGSGGVVSFPFSDIFRSCEGCGGCGGEKGRIIGGIREGGRSSGSSFPANLFLMRCITTANSSHVSLLSLLKSARDL